MKSTNIATVTSISKARKRQTIQETRERVQLESIFALLGVSENHG